MNREAVVSIGTNSTRLLIADFSAAAPAVVSAQSIGTRIGEGLRGRGRLTDGAMRRTLDAIGSYASEISACEGVSKTYAIATSALRRADNGDAFARELEAVLGVPLDVLSGEQEAVASYRGARAALLLPAGKRLGVVDIGGGSTEFAEGVDDMPERAASCEIGAVRLTEACPELAGTLGAVPAAVLPKARALARAALEPIASFATVERLALVGGSATTATALVRGSDERLDFSELTLEQLRGTLERLCALPLAERKVLPGMNPQRADILPAGLIILDVVFGLAGLDRAAVLRADLLLGYLLMRREHNPALDV